MHTCQQNWQLAFTTNNTAGFYLKPLLPSKFTRLQPNDMKFLKSDNILVLYFRKFQLK